MLLADCSWLLFLPVSYFELLHRALYMPPLDTPRYLASAKNVTVSATSSGRIDSTRIRTQANVDSIQLLCIDLIYIIIQHSLTISLI